MADYPNVVGDRDVEWSEQYHGEKFGYRRKSLGSAAGGEKLGCSLYEVPPGRRAWPYHYHLANEEAIRSNPAWREHALETRGLPEASLDDLGWADAYAFGTPTRYGNVSSQLKQFVDTMSSNGRS
jgi:hypothetical protein